MKKNYENFKFLILKSGFSEIKMFVVLLLLLPLMVLSGCEKDEVEELTDAKLVINEVYTFADETVKTNLDFIELYNHSNLARDIGGLILWESGGRDEYWAIPAGVKMAPRSFYVIECDKDLIDPINFAPWGLSKGPDEYIVLAFDDFTIIDSIKLPSMKVDESYGRKTDADEAWVIFSERTKGVSNNGKPERQPVTNTIGLTVNEVYTNNQKVPVKPYAGIDWIELHNSSNVAINIEGFKIEEDSGDPEKAWIVPSGFVVPANGFIVFDVVKDNPVDVGPSFGLGKSGDWVFLYDASGKLISEIEIPPFTDEEEYTAGRKPDGSNNIVVFTDATKGTSNNSAPVRP